MNKRKVFSLLAFFCLTALPAASGESVILTMEGALRRALESNLTVLKSEQALEGARGARKAAAPAPTKKSK